MAEHSVGSVQNRTERTENRISIFFWTEPDRSYVMDRTGTGPKKFGSVRFFLKEPKLSGKKNETASLTNLNIQTTVKLQISNALTNTTDLYNSPFCPEVELLYWMDRMGRRETKQNEGNKETIN